MAPYFPRLLYNTFLTQTRYLQNVNHITLFPSLKLSNGFPFQILRRFISYQSPSPWSNQSLFHFRLFLFFCLQCSSTRSSYDWILLATQVSTQMPCTDCLYPLTRNYLFKQMPKHTRITLGFFA